VIALGTNGDTPNYPDFVAAETQISTGNVTLDDSSSGWVMHPRTRGTLRSLTSTTGEPLLFPHWGDKPYMDVLGYKLGTTTQIPITATEGTSTDCSYVFFGNYAYSEYVMGNDVEIIVDEVSLAGNLQVKVTAYTYSDFVLHYPEAFYVMSGVRS
jgi:HK97 family phage major capsid protein